MKGRASESLKIVCYAVRIPARLAGEGLPVRKLVLPWGANTAIDGPVVLDDSTVRCFAAFQAERGYDRVAFDFEHNTVPGTPAYRESREPREVAAFGVPVLAPGEGLYLDALEWTPDGPKKAVHYCDISPALVFQPGTRKVMGLHSVAFTRAGAIKDLHAFSVPLAAATTHTTGDSQMERAVLLALLGLEDDASDTDIQEAAKKAGVLLKTLSAADVAAMSAVAAQAKALKDGLEVIGKLDLSGVREKIAAFSVINTAAKEGIEGLATRLDKAEQRIIAFDADRVNTERKALIVQARRDGKVLPFSAEALKTVDLDTLREVAANTPATLPLDQRTAEGLAVESFAAGSRGADPTVAASVAAAFGRTPDDLRKAGL